MTKLVDMLDAFAFSQKLADLNIKIDMLSKEVVRLNKKLPSKISAKVAGEILELYQFGFFDGNDKQQIQEKESKCDTTLQNSTDLSPSKNA